MADLTKFSLVAHSAVFNTCTGKLVQSGHNVFPETYVCVELSDGYTFIYPKVFLGGSEFDEEGFETIVTGECAAKEAIGKFKKAGVIDLTQWLPLESPDEQLSTEQYNEVLGRFGASLY